MHIRQTVVPFIAGMNARFSQIPNIPPLCRIMQFHLTPQGGEGDGEDWALFEERHCDLMRAHTHCSATAVTFHWESLEFVFFLFFFI